MCARECVSIRCFSETGSHSGAQAALDSCTQDILLPQPP